MNGVFDCRHRHTQSYVVSHLVTGELGKGPLERSGRYHAGVDFDDGLQDLSKCARIVAMKGAHALDCPLQRKKPDFVVRSVVLHVDVS